MEPDPDPQRDKAYAWQDFLRGLRGDLLDRHGVIRLIGELRDRHVPEAEFNVSFLSRESLFRQYPEARARGMPVGILRTDMTPPTLTFYYGQKRKAWTEVVVLHEFAHVIVHFTWGEDVEPHGPEFMGAVRSHVRKVRVREPADDLRAGGRAEGRAVPAVGSSSTAIHRRSMRRRSGGAAAVTRRTRTTRRRP